MKCSQIWTWTAVQIQKLIYKKNSNSSKQFQSSSNSKGFFIYLRGHFEKRLSNFFPPIDLFSLLPLQKKCGMIPRTVHDWYLKRNYARHSRAIEPDVLFFS